MYNKIVEFNEFKRVREDFQHQTYWENEYRNSHTKEMLLNQLLDQQEKNYPLMHEDSKGNKQFNALLKVLEEKSNTAWLKQILQELRDSASDAYRKITQ